MTYSDIQDLITFTCEAFPLIVGGTVFSYLKKPYRVIFLQLAIVLVVEGLGYYLRKTATTPNLNTVWLYNGYLVVDCGLSLLAAYFLRKTYGFRIFIIIGYTLFFLIWVYSIYSFGIKILAKSAYAVDSMLSIAAYLWVLYNTVMNHKEPVLKLPVFWLCLGALLFYGCNMPYFSLMDVLVKNLSKSSLSNLTYLITNVLCNIQYLLIALSFYLNYRERRAQLIHQPL